jgi:hypothetical protein
MRMWTGAIAAAALVGSTGAHAQGFYVAEPAPVYVAPAPYYAGAPVVVAPAPRYVAPYATYAGPVDDYAYAPERYIVNYRTGRWCTIEPSGYRWCWTP